MLTQRVRGLSSLVALTQGVLAVLLFWVWYEFYQRAFGYREAPFFGHYALYSILIALGLLLEFASRRSQQFLGPLFESSLLRQAPLALRQTVFAIGGLILFLTLAKDAVMSRGFLLTFTPALFAILVWSNFALPRLIAGWLFRGARLNSALLIGPVARAIDLKRWMERKKRLGFRAAGILTNDEDVSGLGIPRLGRPSDIADVLRTENVQQVIFLEIPFGEERLAAVDTILQSGARLLVLSDLDQRLRHPVAHVEDDGHHFLSFHEEPLENPFNRVMKRMLDLAIAVPMAVLILPPLCLLVWLIQKWKSPGRLFHKQVRAGLQNSTFTIWKFRTMHEGDFDQAEQAKPTDARIFPGGRILRRFGIDEFPQILNVLRGEMSLVGPRPHLVEHNRQFAEALKHYHIRSYAKPGITGLAQVRGFRGEAKTPEAIAHRLQSDLSYIENWSLPLDLAILVRTAWQLVLPPPTAY